MRWLLPVLAVAGAHFALPDASGLVRMLVICAALFLAMKLVVLRHAELPLRRAMAFVFLWPGMRARTFRCRRPLGGGARLIAKGCFFTVAGLLLVLVARHYRLTVPLLVGLSLAFHFGVFRIVVGLWRSRGFATRDLFRAPLKARSLSEFWSSRWNVAFTELVQETIYRPAARRWGPNVAAFVGFLLSGVLHEAAISLPVRAGYGGPFLYFALQGLLVLVERRVAGPPGLLWTWSAVGLPLPLCFHRPFLEGVIWPIVT